MEYFAGLDVSMAETHVCVMHRDGAVVLEAKVPSTPADIAAVLAQAPACERIVLETGRMSPMLFHGLSRLGLPIVCIESRQAYQALKSLATHKTDRNDARGLAHLARTGFFKPVHVKSLRAHALRSLIIARKKLVGQRVTLENQVPWAGGRVRGAIAASVDCCVHQTGAASKRGYCRSVRRHAGPTRGARCRARRHRCNRYGHQTTGEGIRRLPPADDHPGHRSADGFGLHGCRRRSQPLQAIA
jgi:hypothetical protein